MLENRRHFRLKQYFDVNWKVNGQDDVGEGTIFNISSSGLLLQTDKVFKPSDNCIMSVEVIPGSVRPFTIKKGKVMWFRRIRTPQERYQCGIQFLDKSFDKEFQQWLDEEVTRLGEASNVNVLSNLVV